MVGGGIEGGWRGASETEFQSSFAKEPNFQRALHRALRLFMIMIIFNLSAGELRGASLSRLLGVVIEFLRMLRISLRRGGKQAYVRG